MTARRIFALSSLLALTGLALVGLVLAQTPEPPYSYEAVAADAIPYAPSPVEGVESAALIGDQTQEGLYVSVGRLSEGVVFPVHVHSDARISTVLSGVMHYGVGDSFDEVEFTAYPAGSVIFTPPNTPHWMWIQEGEVVVQESGYGPSETTFLEGDE